MKRAFSLSTLIHACIVTAFIFSLPKGCTGDRGNGKEHKQASGTSGEKSTAFTEAAKDDGTVEILSEGEVEVPAKQKVKHTCKESFGGIGIQMGLYSEVVEIPEWYPAYKAGIRLGDIILNNESIRGEPGTFVSVRVLRKNEELTFIIKRGIICYKTEEKKK